MSEEDYRSFIDFSVSDYAENLITGEKLSRQEALNNSKDLFSKELPEGLETKDNFLMTIEDTGNRKKVGWIWFSYTKDNSHNNRQVLPKNLLIFETDRRKGFAASALTEMNRIAKSANCNHSVLFVWDHNPIGICLYEKCGYSPVKMAEGGKYMIKEL